MKDRSSKLIVWFVIVVLAAFAISLVCSLVNYLIAIHTPVEELFSGIYIVKSNAFVRFWAFFYYNNPIFFQDRDDIFRDWFSINFMVSSNSPYLIGDSSYPPLVLVFAKFFASMCDYSGGVVAAIASPMGVFSLLLFYFVCFVPTVALIFVACKRAGLDLKWKILLSIAFFCSVPFIFLFDRGNYVFLAIPFLFVYVLWYNSETWWKRELSYVALAVAVGIKLYPAAFALLTLKEKKILGLIRTIFYSVLAVLVPFFCFEGGLDNVSAFLYWLLDFSGSKGGVANVVVYGISYSYSPYNIVAILAGIFGEGVIDLGIDAVAINAEKIGKLLTLFCLVLILFTGLFGDKDWKLMLSATIATLFVPSISFVYSSVMMIFPVLFFLLDKDKRKIDLAYFVLYLIVLAPVVSPMVIPYYRLGFRWGVSLKHILELLSYFALLFLLTFDVAKGCIQWVKTRKKQS